MNVAVKKARPTQASDALARVGGLNHFIKA